MGWYSAFTRMTQIAFIDTPCGIAIVACPTIFAIHDLGHIDAALAGLHGKSQLAMAVPATVAHPVKPMRENHRAKAGFLGVIVQHDITILSLCNGATRHSQQGYENNKRHSADEFDNPWIQTPHVARLLLAIVQHSVYRNSAGAFMISIKYNRFCYNQRLTSGA